MLASRCSLAAAIALLACGEQPGPTRFVAAVADDDGGVSIGLTIQDGLVAGYACGDDPAIEPYPGWFVADAGAEQSIALERDGWTFVAAWSEESAEGVLREPSGAELHWSARPAGGLSGTYAARDSGCTTGVVVVDGHAPVVRGVWCNQDGELRQVTPVAPMTLVDGNLAVEVEQAGGTRTLEVAPVELPLAYER